MNDDKFWKFGIYFLRGNGVLLILNAFVYVWSGLSLIAPAENRRIAVIAIYYILSALVWFVVEMAIAD